MNVISTLFIGYDLVLSGAEQLPRYQGSGEKIALHMVTTLEALRAVASGTASGESKKDAIEHACHCFGKRLPTDGLAPYSITARYRHISYGG